MQRGVNGRYPNHTQKHPEKTLQKPTLLHALRLCQIIWCSPHIYHDLVVCRMLCTVAVCIQQLFTSFAPCPHISWRCFTWSEQNSQAVEPHIVWRNQARMSAAFLKTIWKLLLLQLFDNRPIVCLKQVEYVGGKSQNIAESFQTQMTGTWFVYCARFILQGKSGKLVIWCMESHQENRTSWKSVFQSSLQIYHSGIEISFWYRTIIILLTKYRLLYLTCFVWFL